MALNILSVSDSFWKTENFCWTQSLLTSMGVYRFISKDLDSVSHYKVWKVCRLKQVIIPTKITRSYSADCINKYLHFSFIFKNNNFKTERIHLEVGLRRLYFLWYFRLLIEHFSYIAEVNLVIWRTELSKHQNIFL